MKYILLDFDGVLTSAAYSRQCLDEHRPENMFGLDWFDLGCQQALKAIVDATDAGIVLSLLCVSIFQILNFCLIALQRRPTCHPPRLLGISLRIHSYHLLLFESFCLNEPLSPPRLSFLISLCLSGLL